MRRQLGLAPPRPGGYKVRPVASCPFVSLPGDPMPTLHRFGLLIALLAVPATLPAADQDPLNSPPQSSPGATTIRVEITSPCCGAPEIEKLSRRIDALEKTVAEQQGRLTAL
jgi:hypothetical protein